MRSLLIAMIALTLIAALPGCKNRGAGRRGNTSKEMTAEVLIAKNKKTAPEYKTYSVKGKADLENKEDGSTVSFSYKANILRDSLIWATVTKFGLPLATILADPDSVRIRRLDVKEVMVCDYSILNKAAGMKVDFALMQNIFTGEPDNLEGKSLEFSKEEHAYRLKGKQAHYDVDWIFDPANYKMIQMDVEDASLGMASTLTYGNFLEVESQLVPSEVKLQVKSPNAMNLILEHSKIEFNDPDADFSFRIPKSYEIKYCN